MSSSDLRTLNRAEALAALAFYVEAGVTDAVGDTPVDRFALGDTPSPRLVRSATAAAAAAPRSTGEAQKGSAAGHPSAGPSDTRAEQPRDGRASGGRDLSGSVATSARGGPAALRPALSRGDPPPAGTGFGATGTGGTDPNADGEAAIRSAREKAASAGSLDELAALIAEFEDCPLRLAAKNLVFADGNPEADLMLVGEAPGREEDARGLPFVGRSGQLLDRMLAAIGRDRKSAYITNVIPWRPPGNRTPSPVEVETCRPFAVRHIELVQPKVLVCLGGASAKLLLGSTEGIKRLRGRWHDYDAGGAAPVAAMATLHPAYLLRTPIDKRLAWRDLLAVKQRLDTATDAN